MNNPTKKKRTSKSKPVQRSLEYLRKNGWEVCVVEKWVPPRGNMKFGVRIDAFGFADLLACRPPIGGLPASIALIQCCSTDAAAHKQKILAIPAFYLWKKSGGRVFLQAWKFQGPRGDKHWQMREEEL